MCRVLAYLGAPASLNELLYEPDSSLLKQAIRPQMLNMLNLAGFGMMAWDPDSHRPDVPYRYVNTDLPVFDANLRALTQKLQATCAIAHVRGVPYHDRVHVNSQNLHPFHYPSYRVALAHNGDLAQLAAYKFELVSHVKPEILCEIKGSTDSEWLYALVLSELPEPTALQTPMQLVGAIERALQIVRVARRKAGVTQSSSVNLFVSDGTTLVATRFAFDFGNYGASVHEGNLHYLSQWFTMGSNYGLHDGEWKMIGGAKSADSIIVASEPLTMDTSTWLEVPEYSALCVSRHGSSIELMTIELDA